MPNRHYSIESIDEVGLLSSKDQWQDLLRRSEGDQLFNSWYWASEWWQTTRVTASGEPALCLVVVTENDRWIALAPCYTITRRRRGIPIRQLHMIGSGMPEGNLFRAEYRGLLFDLEHTDALIGELFEGLLNQCAWDEAYFSDVPCDSQFYGRYRAMLPSPLYRREINTSRGYKADLSKGFDAYLSGLSSSARRQIFNKRKRLAASGTLQVRDHDDVELTELTETLNRFHRQRFSHNVLGPRNLQFLTQLTEHEDSDAPKLRHSLIDIDGESISALLDIDIGTRRYNIQLGINDTLDHALSPGLLHLGYSMEAAAQLSIRQYEFLIGTGRSTDYKTRFATEQTDVATIHIVRAGWLRVLQRLHGLVTR